MSPASQSSDTPEAPARESGETSALPDTYPSAQAPYFPPDTTNNLMPILRRRKGMAVGISLLCFGAGMFMIENIPPIYRAHAQIAFPGAQEAFIKTQALYLQDAPLIAVSPAEESTGTQQRPRTTEKLAPEALHVAHPPGSDTLRFAYDAHDAIKAALTLNHYVQAYVAQNNARPEKQDTAIGPTLDQLESPQYTEAKNNYLAQKTRLSAFISKDGSINLHNNEQALESLHSQALDALLARKREALYTIETLSQRYGEKHPKMIAARTALAEVTGQIRQEREVLLGQLIDTYISAKKSL